ncbi:DEAD/DEAH box helicase [Candidatus Pacearchaeota archaeon]|nr:DEAD/DEAH box helicase [Candidatus Pacearchaeota archaeon]
MSNIEFIEKPNTEEDIFQNMNHLLKDWFKQKFEKLTEAQKYSMLNIKNRKNILISSPTGSGKTLSAFGSILDYLISLEEKGELEDKIYAVYVSPLKALVGDIEVNLKTPLSEIEKIAGRKIGIRVAVRTGDTTSEDRAKMLKNPPHILVTTPETIAIVLNAVKLIEKLSAVEFLIVDEIHALANKRGVHLSLSLERLQNISKITPVRIGLSATISPLEEVAKFLVGFEAGKERDCLIADVQFTKKLDMKVLCPVTDLIDVTSLEMHSSLYNLIDKLIQEHKTTLIFTNTRSATERVIAHLKEMFPSKYLENIGAHHSSLSKEHRFDIENRLREGKLKVVVTSTSLELGIDIGYIDLVILLGSPKSVARALQRCLPYDSKIVTSNGEHIEIGKMVEKNLPVEVISYDEKRGFIKNNIRLYHKNEGESLIRIKLKCGEEIKCTAGHPILTKRGWERVEEIKKNDLVAEIRNEIKFDNTEPYLFELLPKNKIFVVNKDNFFQKKIDEHRKQNKVNARNFVKTFGMDYSRFIDCRRLQGRKKSIRLDYFLKACELCRIPKSEFLPYLHNLKTKGRNWAGLPLKVTEELMWLAGIVATDGCIVKSQRGKEAEYYKIKIGNKSKVMVEKIREITNKLGIMPYETIKQNIYHIEFGSNLLAYLFMSLGIPCKRKSYEIEISNNVFSLPNNKIHAYLEGIFEGDGNLNVKKGENRGVIRIFSASKKFAGGLHLLFSRLGYENGVMKSKIKTSKLIKKVSDIDLYCVVISRKEELRRFFESIPCYGEKAKRGKELTKSFEPYLSLRKDYNKFISYSEVESIEKEEKRQEVYNLTLEKEPNNFIVGNVIVHNCGRAGHKLHEVARGRLIVLDRDDLVECSVLLKEGIERKIDRVQIPQNCLDVLSQQIYGCAIQKIWNIDGLFSLIKQSYCYHNLSKQDFFSVISYLAGEYALEARDVYAKIWYDEKTREIGKRGKLARVIYMTNIGTIPEESFVNVIVHGSDTRIGVIDEEFLERLKPRDVFVLGGHKYEFLYARGMKAYVKATIYRPPTIPSWFSEMLPLSFDLAWSIQNFRSLMNSMFDAKKTEKQIKDFISEYLYIDSNTRDAIYNYFYVQYKYAKVPHKNLLLIEHYSDRGKHYAVFHALYGRRVNDALSRALAYLVARFGGRDIEIGISDNGFFLASLDKMNIEKALNMINEKNLQEILEEAVGKTEVFKRRFRHCAARSLMILRSYKGVSKSVGKQQLKSGFLLGAVRKLDINFPILKETRREIMHDLMDIENAKLIIKKIKQGEIKVKEIATDIPSPFSLGLISQGYADLLKIEDKIEFLKRMHKAVLERIK